MTDWKYVQLRSWHVVLTPTRAINGYRTLCGRNASGPTVNKLPAGRSCETCLRIATRRSDYVTV